MASVNAEGTTTHEDYVRRLADAENQLRMFKEQLADEESGTPIHAFDMTPALVAAAKEGQLLFQGKQTNRASFDPQTLVMNLGNASDLTSFLHESAHFFLEMMATLSSDQNAEPSIVKDFDEVMNWFGLTRERWLQMSLEEKRPYHEQWAENFEVYLFEGKSPSIAMRDIFRTFKDWFVNTYTSLKHQYFSGNKLNDEIRQVMDRLVASEEEIAQAEAMRGYAVDQEAHDEAKETLEKRSLADMQWQTGARSKKLRELQRKNKEKRKAMRSEVAYEVSRRKIYLAMAFFRFGKMPDGTKTTENHKLDIDALQKLYEGVADAPDIKNLGYGAYGILGKEGVTPDQAAELFGFSSGDDLVRSLSDVRPMKEVIEEETDRRMLERYGDLNSPEAMQRAVEEAIHNKARGKAVATELAAMKSMGKAILGRVNLILQAAKE